MTVRLPEDIHGTLAHEATKEKTSIDEVLTRAACSYLSQIPDGALDDIKQAVAAARSRSRRSIADALDMADRAYG